MKKYFCVRELFEVTEAKLDEFENWKKNKVYAEVNKGKK